MRKTGGYCFETTTCLLDESSKLKLGYFFHSNQSLNLFSSIVQLLNELFIFAS